MPIKEGKKLYITQSELGVARDCELKWWLQSERWNSKARLSTPLVVGTLWHQIMESYYSEPRGSGSWLRSLEGYTELLALDPGEDDSEDGEIWHKLKWMLDGYVGFYGEDDDWEVVHTEQIIEAELPTTKGPAVTFRGVVDLVVRNIPDDTLWLVDHKSAKRWPREDTLLLNDQFGLYTWALQQNGIPVLGAIYNGAKTYQTKKPDPLDKRFQRYYLAYTEAELETMAYEAAIMARRLRLLKEDQVVRSPSMDCVWKCPYMHACLSSRKGHQTPQDYLKSAGFHQQDTPLGNQAYYEQK